jgi:hypothetical protein
VLSRFFSAWRKFPSRYRGVSSNSDNATLARKKTTATHHGLSEFAEIDRFLVNVAENLMANSKRVTTLRFSGIGWRNCPAYVRTFRSPGGKSDHANALKLQHFFNAQRFHEPIYVRPKTVEENECVF